MNFLPRLVGFLFGSTLSGITSVSGFGQGSQLAAFGTFLALVSTAKAQEGTVVDVIAGESDLSFFAQGIDVSLLASTFAEADGITVFAIQTAGFLAIQDLAIKFLDSSWVLHQQDLFLYHAVSSTIELASLSDGMVIEMMNGEEITVAVSGSEVTLSGDFFDGVVVSAADLIAENGIVHKVNNVLIPFFAENDIVVAAAGHGVFATVLELIVLAGLEETLKAADPVTLLAPVDDAFDPVLLEYLRDPENSEVLSATLLHHVVLGSVIPSVLVTDGSSLEMANGEFVTVAVEGDLISFNSVAVVNPDVLGVNGIIHGIADVLALDVSSAPSVAPLPTTVIELIAGDSNLSFLSQGLVAAELVTDLEEAEAVTVFGPVNSAFLAIQDLATKFVDPKWLLHQQNLFLFHVLPFVLSAEEITDGAQFVTLNGEMITINVGDNDVVTLSGEFFSGSEVTGVDFFAENGVVHTVGSVMLPEYANFDIFAATQRNGSFSILVDLIVLAGLEDFLRTTDAVTLLAPVDSSFSTEIVEFLSAPDNLDTLTEILTYHVVLDVVPSFELVDGEGLETVNGETVSVGISDSISFDGVGVISQDLLSFNGITYALGSFLDPRETLAPSLLPSGAPSPAPVPIEPTGTPTVMPSPIPTTLAPSVSPSISPTTSTDSPSTSPSFSPSNGPSEMPSDSPPADAVLDIVTEESNLSLMELSLSTLGLTEELSIIDPLSIFAPTDTAILTVDGTIQTKLQAPGWGAHSVNLFYLHFAAGNFASDMLVNGQEIQMLNSEFLTVSISEGVLTLSTDNGSVATVSERDFLAQNGALHKLDTLLLPNWQYTSLIQGLNTRRDQFSTFLDLIVQAGLEETLSSGAYTLLAPVNYAFEQVPSSLLNSLSEDDLETLLLNHAVVGIPNAATPEIGDLYPSSLLENDQFLPTASGKSVLVSIVDDQIFFDQALVLAADGLANNGISHAIGSVLGVDTSPTPAPAPTANPPSVVDAIEEEEDLTTLSTALETASLSEALSPASQRFTVFAPTNAAFDDLESGLLTKILTPPWILHLQELLKLHVHPTRSIRSAQLGTGSLPTLAAENLEVTVNSEILLSSEYSDFSATVIEGDVEADNGIVHKIDRVIFPQWLAVNLFEISELAGVFTITLELLVLTGVDDTVQSSDLTIFGPVDRAWNALPEETLAFYRNADNADETSQILLYHAATGIYPSSLLFDGQMLPTAQGQNVTVSVSSENTFQINDAPVLQADGLASNGIGYAIDKVLTPPDVTSAPSTTPTTSSVGRHFSIYNALFLIVAFLIMQ